MSFDSQLLLLPGKQTSSFPGSLQNIVKKPLWWYLREIKMSFQCSDEVFQRAYQTPIPCLLTDGKENATRKELTPQELLNHQKDASVATGDTWRWVESCIKPVGANDWLVIDESGNQINCVNSFFEGTRHIYSVVIKNVRHEFKCRYYAVAACLATRAR